MIKGSCSAAFKLKWLSYLFQIFAYGIRYLLLCNCQTIIQGYVHTKVDRPDNTLWLFWIVFMIILVRGEALFLSYYSTTYVTFTFIFFSVSNPPPTGGWINHSARLMHISTLLRFGKCAPRLLCERLWPTVTHNTPLCVRPQRRLCISSFSRPDNLFTHFSCPHEQVYIVIWSWLINATHNANQDHQELLSGCNVTIE